MPKKDRAYESNDNELFDEFGCEVFDCAINQFAAVIRGYDFHARRQARLELVQLRLDRGYGLSGVLARAKDHHAAGGFTLAVELGTPASYFGPQLEDRKSAV